MLRSVRTERSQRGVQNSCVPLAVIPSIQERLAHQGMPLSSTHILMSRGWPGQAGSGTPSCTLPTPSPWHSRRPRLEAPLAPTSNNPSPASLHHSCTWASPPRRCLQKPLCVGSGSSADANNPGRSSSRSVAHGWMRSAAAPSVQPGGRGTGHAASSILMKEVTSIQHRAESKQGSPLGQAARQSRNKLEWGHRRSAQPHTAPAEMPPTAAEPREAPKVPSHEIMVHTKPLSCCCNLVYVEQTVCQVSPWKIGLAEGKIMSSYIRDKNAAGIPRAFCSCTSVYQYSQQHLMLFRFTDRSPPEIPPALLQAQRISASSISLKLESCNSHLKWRKRV